MNEGEHGLFFCVYVNHHTDDDERWIQKGKLYIALNNHNDFVPPTRKSALALPMCRRGLSIGYRTDRRERG